MRKFMTQNLRDSHECAKKTFSIGPYGCSLCDYNCASMSLLNKHLKEHKKSKVDIEKMPEAVSFTGIQE